MKWRCPHCGSEVEVLSLDGLPHLPFCSERCKMADLHGWLSDRYVISRPVEEGDIGETSAADLAPPRGQAGRRSDGPGPNSPAE